MAEPVERPELEAALAAHVAAVLTIQTALPTATRDQLRRIKAILNV